MAGFTRFDRTSHDVGQLGRGSHGLAGLAASHKRLCNRASKPFFSISLDHFRKFIDRSMGQVVGHALALGGVHAHVQRRIEAEAEAALRVVNLRRRHADVHQQTVHGAQAQLAHHLAPMGEGGMLDAKARIGDGLRTRGRVGDGLGIAVQRQQLRLGSQVRQQQTRVATAAKSGVHVQALRVRADLRVPEGIDRLGQQDGGVLLRFRVLVHRGQNEKSCRASGIAWAMTSASCAA